MAGSPNTSSGSELQLLSPSNDDNSVTNNLFLRDPSAISTKDIQFPKLLENGGEVEEQTVMQVEFVNDNLLRKNFRCRISY